MSGGPKGTLIMPDPYLTRDRIVTATDRGTNMTAGPSSPATTAQGDLFPYPIGTPVADIVLKYMLVRSGGLYECSEWVWKYQEDGDDQWRGQDDVRRQWDAHDPFADDPVRPVGLAAIVSSVFRRVLLFRWAYEADSSVWDVRYRDIDSETPTTWSSTKVTFERNYLDDLSMLTGWELPDGTLQILQAHGSSVDTDLDLYASTDGGLTWTRVARDIISTWIHTSGSSIGIRNLKSAISGDWIRVAWVDDITKNIQSMISSDRGATWAAFEDIDATVFENGDTEDTYGGSMALAGCGTIDGAFIMWGSFLSSSSTMSGYTARRNEEWQANTNYDVVNQYHQRMCAALGNSYLYFLCSWDMVGIGTEESGWEYRYILRKDCMDPANIRTPGTTLPRYYGTQKYTPSYIQMAHCGDSMLVFGGLVDNDDGGVPFNGTFCFTIGRWSRRPVHLTGAKGTRTARLYHVSWDSPWGNPDTLGGYDTSPDTPYYPEANLTNVTWTPDYYEMTDHNSAAYRRVTYGNHTLAYKWGDGSFNDWMVKMVAGSTTTVDGVGMRITAAVSPAIAGVTRQVDLSVRLCANSGPVVYDNVAHAKLWCGTALTQMDQAWYEVRVALSTDVDSGQYKADVAFAPEGDNEWTSSGALTLAVQLASAGFTTGQIVKWGHLAGHPAGSTQTSWWRHHGMVPDSDMDNCGYVCPRDIRGAPTSAFSQYTANGVWTRWAGGGGFEWDLFTGEIVFVYGEDSIFVPSPEIQWRSVSGVAANIVFDRDATYGAAVWQHDAVSLFGTTDKNAIVEWSDSNEWTAPPNVLTLTSVLRSGIVLQSVTGNRVVLPAAYDDGSFAGGYMQIESVSDPHYGKTVKIEHQEGTSVSATGLTKELIALGFSPGTTVTIFGDKMTGFMTTRIRRRFMRVTFPASPDTATGDHRIGALIAGTTLPMEVPARWAHPDNTEPNVQIDTAESGARMSFVKGKPRRKLVLDIEGDASCWRDRLQSLLRTLADYSHRPMVFIPDDTRPSATAVLCRFLGTYELKQDAWRQTVNGEWKCAGSVSLNLEEEV